MEKSKGLGDTVEKILKATGVKKIVEATTKAAGIEDCVCEERRDKLNKMFPYKK